MDILEDYMYYDQLETYGLRLKYQKLTLLQSKIHYYGPDGPLLFLSGVGIVFHTVAEQLAETNAGKFDLRRCLMSTS